MQVKISDILKMMVPGVFIIINETTKEGYIGYSGDISVDVLSWVRNNSLKYSNTDAWDLKILDTLGKNKHAELDKKIKYNYWVDYYSNAGYNLTCKFKPQRFYLTYDVVSSPSPSGYMFQLFIASPRGAKELIGVFDNKAEMDEWSRDKYSNSIRELIYKE
jgi:hypothetical protein